MLILRQHKKNVLADNYSEEEGYIYLFFFGGGGGPIILRVKKQLKF